MTYLYVTTNENEARKLLGLEHDKKLDFFEYGASLGESIKKSHGLCFNPMMSIQTNGTNPREVERMVLGLLKHEIWVAAQFDGCLVEHYNPKPVKRVER